MKNARRYGTSNIASIALVIIVPTACLALFADKAFHIDDTLFVWTARHIVSHPLDFYGFSANWYGIESPVWLINKNPPLASYYMALVGVLLGWSEVALHVGFLLAAVGLSLGTYVLARLLCGRPDLAALMTVFTPVFVVSSSTVMTDTSMLALFVWAAALWLNGLEEDRPFRLFIAGLLIASSALTKYFGMALVPLLFVYSWAARGSLRGWLPFLMLPVALLVGYEVLTHRLYGQGLIWSAMIYPGTSGTVGSQSVLVRAVTGLSFTGGCLAVVAFYVPLLWPKRWWMMSVVTVVVVAAALIALNCFGRVCLHGPDGLRWGLVVQFAVFVAAGLHLFVLACDDLRARRDPASVLLFLWIVGTFAFTTFVNWTTNGRTVFPMAPAAAILVVRRLDRMAERSEATRWWLELVPLIPAAVLALAVAWADFSLAARQRTAGHQIMADLRGYPHTVWFQGHWGFQHYMEAAGARAQDFKRSELRRGDLVVVPVNNTNLRPPPERSARLVGKKTLMPFPYVATMDQVLGAGFYSDLWGPLPFAVGRSSPEIFLLFVVDPVQ